ncbi:hypothetical protein [Streptomyces sp. NPDC047000]|uniref:hypothetical protein n=1 Tax=Streptomyces sp. NPDC047000 TaxID=3155474 RepID=UPI0034093614
MDKAEADGADNIDALREERSEAAGLAEGVLFASELVRMRKQRKTVLAQVRTRVDAPEQRPTRHGVAVPPDLAALIDHHAAHAIVLDDFHHRLLTRSKRTSSPAAELRRALVPYDHRTRPNPYDRRAGPRHS